jgi:hypothetical protein
MLSYDELPKRRIVSSPFPKKELVSYGIVAIATENDKKWFAMIQPQFTPSMKFLIHGAYRPVHLNELLENLTISEITKIQKIVTDKDHNEFSRLFTEITGLKIRDNGWYGYYRLLDISKEIINYNPQNNLREPTFSFPKGKAYPKEDHLTAALREFQEEMGFKIKFGINTTPIDYFETGIADRSYKMRCWKCNFNKKYDIEKYNIKQDREIAKRFWIDPSGTSSVEKYPMVKTSDNSKVYITSELMNFINDNLL